MGSQRLELVSLLRGSLKRNDKEIMESLLAMMEDCRDGDVKDWGEVGSTLVSTAVA